MKQHALGIAALFIGAIALGLVAIPGLVLDRPPPPTTQTEPAAEFESKGVTIKYKKFSITLGKGEQSDDRELNAAGESEPALDAEHAESLNHRDLMLKWFTVAGVSFALIGLILGPISWAREKQPALAGSAMALCCLAIVWQYVVIGIVLGVTIVVLLILLSHFS